MSLWNHRAFTSVEFFALLALMARFLSFAPLTAAFVLRWCVFCALSLAGLAVAPAQNADQLVGGLALACLVFVTLEERFTEKTNRPFLLLFLGVALIYSVQAFWKTGELPVSVTIWSALGGSLGALLLGGFNQERPRDLSNTLFWLGGFIMALAGIVMSFMPMAGFLPFTLYCLSFPLLGRVLKENPATRDSPAAAPTQRQVR